MSNSSRIEYRWNLWKPFLQTKQSPPTFSPEFLDKKKKNPSIVEAQHRRFTFTIFLDLNDQKKEEKKKRERNDEERENDYKSGRQVVGPPIFRIPIHRIGKNIECRPFRQQAPANRSNRSVRSGPYRASFLDNVSHVIHRQKRTNSSVKIRYHGVSWQRRRERRLSRRLGNSAVKSVTKSRGPNSISLTRALSLFLSLSYSSLFVTLATPRDTSLHGVDH